MSKSIMSNKYECYVCLYPYDLHRHHIFFGFANRKLSERDGCWCYLCAVHHNMSRVGVHFNRELDLKIKRECQEKWEETYGDRKKFIQRYGKSYI